MAYETTPRTAVPSEEHTVRSYAAMPAFALTALRVVVGIIMTVHGFQKLGDIEGFQMQVAQMGMPLPATFALLAIAGEFLGGLGLIVGFLTRIAGFGVFCTMAVAVFLVHLPNGLLASNNGFEYPLTLLCTALLFIAHGAGPISLDAVLIRAFRKSSKALASDPVYARPERVPQPPARAAAKAQPQQRVDPVDQAGMESFPASDPPARASLSRREDEARHR